MYSVFIKRGTSVLFVILLVFVSGCGGGTEHAQHRNVPAAPGPQMTTGRAAAGEPTSAKQTKSGNSQTAGQGNRIYRSQLHVVVEDFDIARESLTKLTTELGGYISSEVIETTHGARRLGVWVSRIPVNNHRTFLTQAADLGVLESQDQTAIEVTEELIDLNSRLTVKRTLEQRVLQLLKRENSDLKEVFEVEEKLATVRTEIEQIEGRLRYLKDMTSFSTVTTNIREEKDFVPATAPTLTEDIASTWTASVSALLKLCRAALVVFVSLLPWIVPVSIAAMLIRMCVRWRARSA